MEFEVVRGSSLGFYARKNAIPTMTLNDVKDVIAGFKDNSLHRQTRSIVSPTGSLHISKNNNPSRPKVISRPFESIFVTSCSKKSQTELNLTDFG